MAIAWRCWPPSRTSDPARIGIRGTGYGGGHVVFPAGHDNRIRAVVAQIGGSGFPADACEPSIRLRGVICRSAR